MIDTRMLSQFDLVLFACTVFLVGLGTLMIYSATFQTPSADLYVRQLQWLIVSGILFVILLNVDYHSLSDFSVVLYVLSILLLIAVLLFGKRISGAKSWFSLGVLNFQPSEIAKVSTILLLAKYLSGDIRTFLEKKDYLICAGITGLPMFLIMLQPDFGTTLTFLPPLFIVLFLCGMRYKTILMAAAAGAASLPVLWLFLKPYQKDRIFTFLDPSKDPLGAGYQIIQSKIAVGSGQIFGKGLFSKETQAYLDYIPEKQTDFIFSILAENFGFIGVVVALTLYFILIYRCLAAAKQSRDRLGTLIVMGILSVLFFHVIVNISMIIGLMPITGLPLPLMSYGGSSLLSTIMGITLILNVRMRRFVN